MRNALGKTDYIELLQNDDFGGGVDYFSASILSLTGNELL